MTTPAMTRRVPPPEVPASRYAGQVNRAAGALRGIYAALSCPELYDEQAERGGPDYEGLLAALEVTAEHLEDLADAMAHAAPTMTHARGVRRVAP